MYRGIYAQERSLPPIELRRGKADPVSGSSTRSPRASGSNASGPDLSSKCVDMFARPPANMPFRCERSSRSRRQSHVQPGSDCHIDGLLGDLRALVSSLSLMTGIAPIALSRYDALWIVLYGWAVLRNEVSETVPIFLWKVGQDLVSFSRSHCSHRLYLSAVCRQLPTALAMGIGKHASFHRVSIQSCNGHVRRTALLDASSTIDASQSKSLDMHERGGHVPARSRFLQQPIFSVGSHRAVPVYRALRSHPIQAIPVVRSLPLVPLFVLCLAWRPTARFFDSWLSMVLNAVVLTWFAFFALGLSIVHGPSVYV